MEKSKISYSGRQRKNTPQDANVLKNQFADGTANYFARLANYFLISQSLSLPWMLKKIGGRDRKLLTVLMVLGYLAYFYYANAINQPFDQDFARLSLSEYLAQLGG